MKKIFILTGEPSGDKLASKVISKLKNSNTDIEYLSVGGEHLKALGIKSLYDLKEVTYLGFTRVLFNIFKTFKQKEKNYLIISITPYTFFAYLILFIFKKKIFLKVSNVDALVFYSKSLKVLRTSTP